MAQLHHSLEELHRTRSPAHIDPKPNTTQVVTVQCLEELQRTCSPAHTSIAPQSQHGLVVWQTKDKKFPLCLTIPLPFNKQLTQAILAVHIQVPY